MNLIKTHKDLEVFQLSYKLAMEIFQLTKTFPRDEIYALSDQIKRSSRYVSANITEAFRKRRYEKAFVAKLSDAEGESAETQVHLDFAKDCGYISENDHSRLYSEYDHVLGKLMKMINSPEKWSN